MPRTIGTYLYDEVEVLDFAGPFEVFLTASRLKLRDAPTAPPPFEVALIADRPRTICARGGLRVEVAFGLSQHPPLDVLLIPGGVVTAEMERPALIEWIRRTAASAELTASVCTAAFLLAQAGLLNGQPATTHWEDLADLGAQFPEIQLRPGARWVEAGKIVTAAGISAGTDLSLHLVARLEGQELAERTARQMEYDWR
jgi:transcriptional regulator GlxA family with amidase domain